MTKLSGAAFPVVFFDGEREIDIGSITVHPSLGFKNFQTLISDKIGIAPHQITVSLVRRKKARSSPDIRRKVPIDESSDFSEIARERDCFILAVLKRSRRGKRGRPRRSRLDGGGSEPEVEQKNATSPAKTILKRNPAEFGGPTPELRGLGLGLWDYDEVRMRNLQSLRERYLMSTAAYYSYPKGNTVVCEECLGSKEKPVQFHWCVYDTVTVGFRSPAGPIERPTKGHVEASA